MARTSAGLLLYRLRQGGLEVLLVHPGGPFWMKKDLGAWSIPKGEFTETEDPLAAARRELKEETGFDIDSPGVRLTPRRQPSGKTVYAWAVEADVDASAAQSSSFRVEWPRGSGRYREFPEIDRTEWFPLDEARTRILSGQRPFLDELAEHLRTRGTST
jgi:predicted NUDIX family NTP pyrophosphohydrolase